MHSRKPAKHIADTERNRVNQASQRTLESEQSGPWFGLQPAYRDNRTGEIHLAITEDGALSSVHTFNGLPDQWVDKRDDQGRALALKPQVVAGFWRAAIFIELGGVLSLPHDA